MMRRVISLAAVLGATADAVCTPALTYSNTKLTAGWGAVKNVLYIPETTTAVGITEREIFDWDTTATTATITPNVRAGNVATGTWAGDQVNGANARFSAYGGTVKPDGTMVYFSLSKALAKIPLSGNYAVTQFAGDQTASSPAGCAEGDGTAARLDNPRFFAIADATGDTVLVAAYGCHRLALVETNSPHTLTWKGGTGNSLDATAAGYGTSAPIKYPQGVTFWRDRFYVTDKYSNVLGVQPAANWRVFIITTGQSPQATTNDIPFDNTYHSARTFGSFQGSLSTWSNCLLHLFQQGTQVGHIVDPEGGNMFLLAGIASPSAYFASADLSGNVWVSGHAGTVEDLGKYSIAYTGCPAVSPHKCKWGYMTATATATATLPAVSRRTRTATPPMTTLAPMTTGPVTTTAVSSSTSASSGGAATISAATSAAATSAAATSAPATTAVVGTTAAAVTTTVATSTTAAAGSTSSSSGSTGNGASSATAAALGLVTMVLAMF